MSCRIFATAVVLVLLALGIAAQTGLGTRAEQVRVEIRVTDDNGAPVTDLGMSDFEIRDDGAVQDIATFTLIDSRQNALSNHSNPEATAASAAAAGRMATIVLDDLHVAATNTPRVKAAVRAFIEAVVGPADSVAVVFTSGASRGGQDFTSDRRLVLDTVDRFRGQKLRSATVERLEDPRLNIGGVVAPNSDPNQADRANRARIALDSLRRIGEALVPFESRRPLVLFVSEGPEYEVADGAPSNRSDQRSINRDIRAAIETLNRVNAVVFAIDPRGVSAGNADQIHTSSVFESLGVGTSAIANENMRALGVVQALSANTGGLTMLWRPDMSRDFRRVVASDGSYYVVSYGAPSTNRGKYHNISVKVRKSGLQVRARSGYVLPALNTVQAERPGP